MRQFAMTITPGNTRVVLNERAFGNPTADLFKMCHNDAIPKLEDGAVLVKNAYVSVDPAMKGWISTAQNYASVATGDTMAAFGVGEVVESKLEGVKPGDIVTGRTGWQEYGIADPSQPMFRVLAPGSIPEGHRASTALGVLGINGLTAYFGLKRLGRPEPGQTVLVSTAAGATGSVVGQLAAAEGCRVVGIAGGGEKNALCTGAFGYDAALDHKRLGPGGPEMEVWLTPALCIMYDSASKNHRPSQVHRLPARGKSVDTA